MVVKFNNRLGNRSRHHMNLLVADLGDQTLIFPFEGKGIPGVATIVATRSEQNGKWSFTEWEVELAEGIRSFVWSEDWNEGVFVTAGQWGRAIEDVRRISGISDLDAAAIERFIRAKLARAARRLDEAEREAQADPAPILAELLAAQEDLAKAQAELLAEKAQADRLAGEIQQAIDARAAAKQARIEAKATAERVAKAKAAMAKGASLADLKQLMAA